MTSRFPITCATDLRDSGARAADLALSVAGALDRPMELVHVADVEPVDVSPAVHPAMTTAVEAMKKRLEERAREVREALESEVRRLSPDGRIERFIVAGHPADAIADHVAQRRAAMVVVGPHERGSGLVATAMDGVFRSTAERLLGQALCPVLVATDEGPSTVGDRWMVGVDVDDQASLEALDAATSLAAKAGASLTVVHVAPEEAGNAARARRYEDRLELMLASVGATRPVARVIRWGAPALQLQREVQDGGATLLVIGTHARRGIARVLLGSVARDVLRTAQVPILIVPYGATQYGD